MGLKALYARYCSWCESMGIPPARFEAWRSLSSARGLASSEH